jgi:hypothetical protein
VWPRALWEKIRGPEGEDDHASKAFMGGFDNMYIPPQVGKQRLDEKA